MSKRYSISIVTEQILPDSGNGAYRLLRGFAQRAVSRLHVSVLFPEEAQRERLDLILKGLKGTQFAREHGITQSDDFSSWRKKVPVRSYNELSGWLQKVSNGESDVLTNQPTVQLLKTSGTTGPAKFLLVTRVWSDAVSEAQSLWRLGLVKDHEAITRGKVLTVVSPGREGVLKSGLAWGSNTGRMRSKQPWIVRMRYSAPEEVHGISDPSARLYTILRFALNQPISSITTANPSTVLMIARGLREFQDSLAEDCLAGELSRGPAKQLSREVQSRLGRYLKCVKPPDDWRPAKIWDLSVINCWKGGPAPFFIDQFEEALGGVVPVREVGITASEGYFAIPLSDGDAGGVAWMYGALLEFESPSGEVLFAWELEVGVAYRLIISTTSGLYRYDLDDVVEVVGFTGKLPRLKFLRKGSNMLNITGEKVSEDQVVSSVRELIGTSKIVGFTASHQLGEVPSVVVGIEGAESLPLGSGHELDRLLMQKNVEYAAKRESGRLGPLSIRALPKGTFAAWRVTLVKEGAPAGQVKDLVIATPAQWERLTQILAP